MPIPNGGLITETNAQYYAGAQELTATTALQTIFQFTFNTPLVFGSYNPSAFDYDLNNFKLYTSIDNGLTYTEYVSPYSVVNSIVTLTTGLSIGTRIVAQLKTITGGNYGAKNAFGTAVEENYGGYAYTSLNDIVNNFIVSYVGEGKIVGNAKRTDVVFHTKRCLQELSYDTFRSIKQQELSVPNNLTIPLPQDYVNYVKISWVDESGTKHPLKPTTLTSNPSESPVQDSFGIAVQDDHADNIDGTSIIEERWLNNGITNNTDRYNQNGVDPNGNYYTGYYRNMGQRYGLEPQYANFNGVFTINEREGKMSFSSDLLGALIIFEYISDGLAYELDTRVPKLAEEAVYAYVVHAIISTRANQPEYLVNRFKQEKFAKVRNAKIRLSNIKLEEITQVLRGQSKWIKS